MNGKSEQWPKCKTCELFFQGVQFLDWQKHGYCSKACQHVKLDEIKENMLKELEKARALAEEMLTRCGDDTPSGETFQKCLSDLDAAKLALQAKAT